MQKLGRIPDSVHDAILHGEGEEISHTVENFFRTAWVGRDRRRLKILKPYDPSLDVFDRQKVAANDRD